MICLQQNSATGALEVLNPQPSNLSTCTMVLQSAPEVYQVPWNMTVEDGSIIGASIVGVWGIAWAFKALIITLKGNENEQTE